MTRDEAKSILFDMLGNTTIIEPTEQNQAILTAIKALEQEPCDDEYIEVPKKALKYRTAGMVAYNAEWLKNHFDMERAIICGEQQPCEDAVMDEILGIIHSTIYDFMNESCDDEESPLTDKDKLLLSVNKAICNNLKKHWDKQGVEV